MPRSFDHHSPSSVPALSACTRLMGKVSSRRAYTGKVISMDVDTVQFPDGSVGDLEMIRHPGASAIVPFLSDPAGEDPQVLLIRQYRYAAEGYLYEIPAGRLDPGEAPEACAMRELKEETGCSAAAVAHLFTMIRLRASPTRRSMSSLQPDWRVASQSMKR